MIYTRSRHGNSFDYNTADKIKREDILESTFDEYHHTSNRYRLDCTIKNIENLDVKRNKTLDLFSAEVGKLNKFKNNYVDFHVHSERIGEIRYCVTIQNED